MMMEFGNLDGLLSNKMLDNVIENIGPEVAEAMIRTGVDKGDRL
mgnify:CR=1 FL=1